jgi:hypothetical protein
MPDGFLILRHPQEKPLQPRGSRGYQFKKEGEAMVEVGEKARFRSLLRIHTSYY